MVYMHFQTCNVWFELPRNVIFKLAQGASAKKTQITLLPVLERIGSVPQSELFRSIRVRSRTSITKLPASRSRALTAFRTVRYNWCK